MSGAVPQLQVIGDGGALAHLDPGACRHLWASVLAEQVALATQRGSMASATERATAAAWFGTRDFFAVCSLAGVDGHWVLRKVRPMIANPRPASRCNRSRRAV